MERVRGKLPVRPGSGVPQRMSLDTWSLPVEVDIFCCLGGEQPGLDLQNALGSFGAAADGHWHCGLALPSHTPSSWVKSFEGRTVNGGFNTNISQRWLGRCPEKGLAAVLLLERLGVAGFPHHQLEVITNPGRRWAGMNPVLCGMVARPGRDLDPPQGQALLLRLFTSEIKHR